MYTHVWQSDNRLKGTLNQSEIKACFHTLGLNSCRTCVFSTAKCLQTFDNLFWKIEQTDKMAALLLCICLPAWSLTLTAGVEERTGTTQNTDQPTTISLPAGTFDHNATDKQSHRSLRADSNCTNPSVSLYTVTKSDRSTLLTFSAVGDQHMAQAPSSTCGVQLTSQPSDVIFAVLLNHSVCDGGVFVLLWDNTRHRRWDMCSAWNVPGPDFVTSSSIIYISIELVEVTVLWDFAIKVRATKKTPKGELELKYLSSVEGKLLFHILILFWGGAGGGGRGEEGEGGGAVDVSGLF